MVGTENPDVETSLDYVLQATGPSWRGIRMRFPFGEDIEERGYGQYYAYNKQTRETRLATHHEVLIRFPEEIKWAVQDVPKEQIARFPEHLRHKVAVFRVRYRQEPTVYGFGKEFANPGHPSHNWLRHNHEVVPGMTLAKFVSQKEFMLVVGGQPGREILEKHFRDSLTKTWSYPYGNVHDWDVFRYMESREVMEGSQFQARTVFDDDNEHVAVLTQQVVQDAFWAAREAAEIFSSKFPAYFVPVSPDKEFPREYYAIVRLGPEFSDQYQTWSRFTGKESPVGLAFHRDDSDMEPPSLEETHMWKKLAETVWLGKVIDNPASVPVLKDHQVNDGEIVLFVRRDSDRAVPTFQSREEADGALSCGKESHTWVSLLFDTGIDEARRKVEAVCQFLPRAAPTNPEVCAARFDPDRPDELPSYMELHRELMHGAGFYKSLHKRREDDFVARVGALSVEEHEASQGCSVPYVDLIGDMEDAHLLALTASISEDERRRFMLYMAKRHLGLALVTAPPGFGKTTVMSVGTLLMQSAFTKVYVSAPTHVAVDNFAVRLYETDSLAMDRLNERMAPEDLSRERRKFIVRAYKIDDEILAFRALLRNHTLDTAQACPSGFWRGTSKWRLELSLAYWLLRVLGSPAVPKLHADDAAALHTYRTKIDDDKSLSSLRALRDCAQQKLPWRELQDVKGSPLSDDSLGKIFAQFISWADMVCTTPSLSEKQPFKEWKTTQARAIAVDEAANMGRADLCCVWGNTLLPCLLGGDDCQFRPAVMTVHEGPSPEEKVFYQRHVQDSQMSPLAHFKNSGVPAHRPKKQFRMGRGLFDAVAEIVYRGLDFEYGPMCDISLPVHKAARDVEAYLQAHHSDLSPPAKDRFAPVFLHCPGTFVKVNPVSGSQTCRAQCQIALGLAKKLVVEAGVSPSQVVMICPYKANVQVIERMRKHIPSYSILEGMRPCATVGSFQGQEGDVIIIVIRTNNYVGPGFTKDENRLCVMFSRQRSALLVVGDITVAGRYLEPGVKATTKEEKAAENKEKQGNLVSFSSGDIKIVKALTLRKFYQRFADEGRVAVMENSDETAAEKKELEEALAKLKEEKAEKEKAKEAQKKAAKAKGDLDKATGAEQGCGA